MTEEAVWLEQNQPTICFKESSNKFQSRVEIVSTTSAGRGPLYSAFLVYESFSPPSALQQGLQPLVDRLSNILGIISSLYIQPL